MQGRETARLSAANAQDIARAAEMLRTGSLVAIPTETVYGLAANAMDATAVERVFQAKDRPGWDPLIVHVSDDAMLRRVVREVSAEAQTLMNRFWPGPLTLLLPRAPELPGIVTAGRDLVGVRMPAHPVAREVIRQAGVPLAAPSANRFGHISPTSAAHVLADLDGRIDAVLDAGESEIGVESTVMEPGPQPMLYRQGGVTLPQLEATLKRRVLMYQHREDATRPAARPESLPSPGVDMRHYAPRARVMLVVSLDHLKELLAEADAWSTGILLPRDWELPEWPGTVVRWEKLSDAAGLARTLYGCLRALDATGVTTMMCPLPQPGAEPLVEAVRDRLMKASRD